jgi:cytochrome c5
VSKQDTHFFNTFSMVLGLLVGFTVLMFALARYVGNNTQSLHVLEDNLNLASVEQRLAPPVRVAVVGQDNSALTIRPAAGAVMTAALPMPKDGPEAFEAACKSCHGAGLAGAPMVGDKAAWAPRIAQGKATLYQHAINGYQNKGVMPAKGGRADFSEELVKSAVDYMIAL